VVAGPGIEPGTRGFSKASQQGKGIIPPHST